jgi:hypothetical protein
MSSRTATTSPDTLQALAPRLGVPVLGAFFGGLAEISRTFLLEDQTRRTSDDSRGAPTVHDAASSCTGPVLGVCASAAHVNSGLFCRNAMSRAGENRVVFSLLLLSYRADTKRPIGQGQSELPVTTADKRM